MTLAVKGFDARQEKKRDASQKVKNTVDASQSNFITYLTNFKGVPPLTKIKNILNQI